MATTKEELNALKEKIETLNERLNELTDEELEQVSDAWYWCLDDNDIVSTSMDMNRQMMESKLQLKAGYFDEFSCKTVKCRNNCCQKWIVGLDKEDYQRIMEADCSEELRYRLEIAFKIPRRMLSKNYRVFAMDKNGLCPLLSADGLCTLQIECGQEMIPKICRRFPRIRNEYANCDIYVGQTGCERVVEQLFNTDKFELTNRNKLNEISEQDEKLSGLLDVLDILQDKAIPLERRIELICGENSFADERKLFNISVLNMRTIFNEFYNTPQYSKDTLERYDCSQGYDNYLTDFSVFEKKYPEWRRYFENILANHIVVMEYPYVDTEIKPGDTRGGLKTIYMFMRMISAANTRDAEGMAPLVDSLLRLFRLAEQPNFYRNVH